MAGSYVWTIYAAILGLLYMYLSFRVSQGRKIHQVGFGDGGKDEMKLAVRAHGNFSEYVPLAILLLMAIGILNWPVWLQHGIGILLVIGRVAHAHGMSAVKLTMGRMVGTGITWSVMLVESILILVRVFGIF